MEIERCLGDSWLEVLVLVYLGDVRFHADALDAVKITGRYLVYLRIVAGFPQLGQLCSLIFDFARCLNQRVDDSILNWLVEILLEEVFTFSGHRPERKLVSRIIPRRFNLLANPPLRLVFVCVTLESSVLRGIEKLVQMSLVESHVLTRAQLVNRVLIR